MMSFAEYIWLDGSRPTQQLRSKTRAVNLRSEEPVPTDFPEWSFDGAATGQADNSSLDCVLRPVCVVRDPMRGCSDHLVLCEVFDADGARHPSNTRGELRTILSAGGDKLGAWLGFEQEYTLLRGGRPLGYPEDGEVLPQGTHYCAAGTARAFGREVAEAHAQLCWKAGLLFFGLSASAMVGQWEFQIGYRGSALEDPELPNVADQLWLARYLLLRTAEQFGVTVSFDCGPSPGVNRTQNLHINFSTLATRAPGGIAAIQEAITRLAGRHEEHVVAYGHDVASCRAGLHESCPVREFNVGSADRSASIRIPVGVEISGAGYFEDRRPGACADPYKAAAILVETIAGIPTGTFPLRHRMAYSARRQ